MISFTPLSNRPTQQRAQSTQQEAKKEDPKTIIEEEMYKELIKGGVGLRSDINKWVDQVIALESSSEYPYLENQNINNIGAKIKIWNEIRENYRNYKDAFDLAQKQGGLNEVAVGNGGELFVKDKGAKLKSVSMSEYSKNRDKYNPLTVYELLQEREINPNLAFNNSIYSVIDTALGTEKIIDNIAQLVDKVGSFSHTLTSTKGDPQLMNDAQQIASQITGRKPTKEELEALGKLEQIMKSPSDYNEIKEHTKSSGKYISSALGYIWNSLGREKQLKLSAVAVMSGLENPKELIFDMLRSNKDEAYEMDIKPVDVDKATGTDSESTSSDNKVVTPFEIFHNGKLGRQIIPWNDPSSGKSFNLTATGVSRLMTVEGKPLGANTLFNIINSENGSLVDTSKIFYGDQKVSMNDLNELTYDGGLAMRVYAPVSTSGGIDYYKLEELKRIEEKVNSDPTLTPEQINELYAQSGFSYVSVDDKKQYIMNDRFKPFLMFTAYGTDEMDSTKNNAKIKALSGGEEDQIEDILNRIWSENKVSAPVGKIWTHYYKGMIAIPYIEDSSVYAGTIAKNIKSPTSTLADVRLQKEKAKGTTINASSQNLW